MKWYRLKKPDCGWPYTINPDLWLVCRCGQKVYTLEQLLYHDAQDHGPNSNLASANFSISISSESA